MKTHENIQSRSPSRRQVVADRVVRGVAAISAAAVGLLLLAVIIEIGRQASPMIAREGLAPLGQSTWDVSREQFGLLPAIGGTLYTSLLALALGGTCGLAVAIVLSQGFLPRRLEAILRHTVELLAGVPSVVFGLWGVFVVIPLMRGPSNWLHDHFAWFPPFGNPPGGPAILPAAVVLAIMILPTVSAISRDALAAVPARLRDGAFALGATRWEVILRVVLPTASGGVASAIVLAFGRALGETMAVAMLIGNAHALDWSLFSPACTLASVLANQFPEASGVEVAALMLAALTLLAITFTINALGSFAAMHARSFAGGLKS